MATTVETGGGVVIGPEARKGAVPTSINTAVIAAPRSFMR